MVKDKFGWGVGKQIHETMIDCVELLFSIQYKTKVLRNFHENGYIYDLYAPKYDMPIEIYSNRIEKLDNLLEKKEKICLIGNMGLDWNLQGRSMLDWISRTANKYCVPYSYKNRFKIIFVSKHKLKGYKHFAEWCDF
jgi:Tat protein secretion system quality control protein TatD with DNase activity